MELEMKKLFIFTALFAAAVLGAGTMTLESGNYKFAFSSGKNLWTMTGIWFKGKQLAHRTGYYGNVFSPASGKYIGAGHTEGGLEKLISVNVNVDGKDCVPAKDAKFAGKKVVFTRVSMLDKIKMSAIYTLTADGMEIKKQFEATDVQKVYQMYLFQLCWGSDSTLYRLYRKDNSVDEGKFFSKEKFPVYGEGNAVAITQFYPKQQTGVVNAFGNFGVVTGKNLLWDRKGYHKYYFWMDLPAVLKKDWKSPEVKLVIRAFDAADEKSWRTSADKAVKELIKDYPFASLPDKIEPLNGEVLNMPPSDKFQCKKVPLRLGTDSKYSIRCKICKNPGMSAKASDNYIVIGYYDSKKKFNVLGALGGHVKSDGKFYSISTTFKTPAAPQSIFAYVYNSRSTGVLSVSDMIVEKLGK